MLLYLGLSVLVVAILVAISFLFMLRCGVACAASMTYLDLLKALLSLGPKLPAILAWLQSGFELFKGLLPSADTGELAITELSEEEKGAERQVADIVAGPSGAFDGSRLRALFTFLQASGLGPILISLLTKLATGGMLQENDASC